MIEALVNLAEACLDAHKTTADLKEARRHFRANIQAAYDLGVEKGSGRKSDPVIASRPAEVPAGHHAKGKATPEPKSPAPVTPAPKPNPKANTPVTAQPTNLKAQPVRPKTEAPKLRPDAAVEPAKAATPVVQETPATPTVPTASTVQVLEGSPKEPSPETAAQAIKNF